MDSFDREFRRTAVGMGIVAVLGNLILWGGLIAIGVWAFSKWIMPYL